MDSKGFDTWTRNRALRLSRRDAVRLVGASGASAALPLATAPAQAQSTCTLSVHAETAAGPSAPVSYDGVLQFTLGADGYFTQATFTPSTAAPLPATGRATGRAIDFQIDLGSGQMLTFSGAGDQPLTACQGAAGGLFTGPQPGDLGVWQTGGSGQTSSAPSLGSSQSGAASTAACAQGQTLCGGVCVATCPAGQTLDSQSCACVPIQPACKPDQSPCEFDFECCGTFCSNGSCGTCPGLVCGEMGCVDPTTDPNNCGVCGNVCVDDTGFCLGGVCSCIPDGEPVGSSSSSCCSQGMVKPDGTCGCSQIGEWCSSVGQCCDNPSGAICVAGSSGFDVCCMATGGTCASDSECCFSASCSNGVCVTK
jgi:hypothetical protein